MKTIRFKIALLAICFMIAGSVQAQHNNAKYISQSTPGEMDVGKSYPISITMKNTGRSTWKQGGFSLKLINVSESFLKTWGVSSVDVNSSVRPGEQIVFNFTITAPDTEGNFNMQWQMAEGNAFFGEPSANLPIRVSGTSSATKLMMSKNDASFTAQKVPTDMDAGQTYDISLTVKNTGGTTWKPGEYKLKVSATTSDNSNDPWVIPDVELPTDIVSGSEAVLNFKVTAPNSSGAYSIQGQVMKNEVPFGDPSTTVTINVN